MGSIRPEIIEANLFYSHPLFAQRRSSGGGAHTFFVVLISMFACNFTTEQVRV